MIKRIFLSLILSIAVVGFIEPSLFAQKEIDFEKYTNTNLSMLEREGDILYLQQSYDDAAKKYLQLADQNMDYNMAYFKLSRCYALLKKPAIAANFLVIAINNGFNDYQLIKSDVAFNRIRENVHFKTSYQDVLNFGKNLGDEILYVNALKKIKCRVFYPDNYDAEKSYPLVVGLHGYGGSTEDFAVIWGFLEKKSFIFVIPEAPYPVRLVGGKFAQFSWSLRSKNQEQVSSSDEFTLRYIHTVVTQMKKQFKVSKSILLGFSQGTAYTYAAAMKYPDDFDGIICFAGYLPDAKKYPDFINAEDLKNNNHLKVFISHGKNDRIDIKSSKDALKIFKKNKYTVTLEVTDLEHYISPNAFRNALDWHGI